MEIPYKRIVIKLSGEALMGDQSFGIDYEKCKKLASAIRVLKDAGCQIAIVLGGGNIFRGVNLRQCGMERTPADHMGMLATLINGIGFKQALESVGCLVTVMSGLECPKVAESYTWQGALNALEKNEVLIFVGGVGSPYFTTDTAAALRASEIHADLLLKATKVDGVYAQDPMKFKEAIKYSEITYEKILEDKLAFMDATAIALCMQSQIPLLVCNMQLLDEDKVLEALSKQTGTLIR